MLSPRAQRDLLALLGVAALALLFWNPLLWPGRVYHSGDLVNLFWPQRVHIARSFAEDIVPLWNEYTWGGSPFHASMQPAVFDPTTWVGLTISDDPIELLDNFDRQRLLIFLILMVNMFALARAGIGLSRGPAALASLLIGCCGFLWWGHFDHVNQLSAMAWSPLVLLGVVMAMRGEVRRPLLFTGAGVGLQLLAGHPQHAAFGAVAASVFAAAWLTLARASLHAWIHAALVFSGGLALGGLIASVQMLPSLELSELSHQVFAGPDYASSFPMRWPHLLRLIWPHMFGVFPNFAETGDNWSELSIFIGRLPIALALLAVAAAMARGRREALGALTVSIGALIALAAFSILYALGSNSFLFEPLSHILFPLRSFRVPARMLFHSEIALALLAACGLQIGIGPLARMDWRPGRVRIVMGAVAILALADLCAISRTDYIRRPWPRELLGVPVPAADAMRAQDERPRVYKLQTEDPLFLVNYEEPALVPRRMQRMVVNTGLIHGVSDFEGYPEGLLPTARWNDLFYHQIYRNLHQRKLDVDLLSLLGVRWVFTDRNRTPIEESSLRIVLEYEDQLGDREFRYTLFENPRALPPLVPRDVVERIAAPESLDGDWSRGLSETPVIREGPTPVARLDAVWPEPESLPRFEVERKGPNQLRVMNSDEFAGNLVFVQSVYPGWIARCQSDSTVTETSLAALNAAWFTLDVPEGTRQIELAYEPTTYRLGLFLSAVGTLCLSLVLALPGAGTESDRRAPARAPAD